MAAVKMTRSQMIERLKKVRGLAWTLPGSQMLLDDVIEALEAEQANAAAPTEEMPPVTGEPI